VTSSRVRRVFFGLAAVTGLASTWYFNLTYRGSAGYLQAWFANSASSSAACDLLVTSTAVSAFMLVEGRRLRMRLPVPYVAFGCVVAMAFTIPLFLLMRERTLAKAATLRRAALCSAIPW